MTRSYLQTSDPTRVVRVDEIRPHDYGTGLGTRRVEIVAEVVSNPFPTVASFSLVNTLRIAAMREAREAAHAEGLQLRQPGVMAALIKREV